MIVRVDENGKPPMETNRVHRNLHMGSAPRRGADVLGHFDVLVLCAEEWQPSASHFPGVRVIHAPLDDTLHVSAKELRIAHKAADHVVNYLALAREGSRVDGRRVLVTCWMGRNRSGLVTALALTKMGASPDVAINLVRRARGEHALSNTAFLDIIRASKRPQEAPVACR